MNSLSRAQAKTLLEEVVPQDDPQYGLLRLFLEVYGNNSDENVTEQSILVLPAYQEFCTRFGEQVADVLSTWYAEEKSGSVINQLHDVHFLELQINQLAEKAKRTKRSESCAIKLAEASGMTEFPSKMDLAQIRTFICQLRDSESFVNNSMSLITKTLKNECLYDNEKSYRVQLLLSSTGRLTICITHDLLRTSNNTSGYVFQLINDKKRIVDILHTHGYHEGQDIETVFDPIINEAEDDDLYDGGACA